MGVMEHLQYMLSSNESNCFEACIMVRQHITSLKQSTQCHKPRALHSLCSTGSSKERVQIGVQILLVMWLHIFITMNAGSYLKILKISVEQTAA